MNAALLAARRRSVPRGNLLAPGGIDPTRWYQEGLAQRTPNAGLAPDGTLTAAKLTENTADHEHYIFSFDTPELPGNMLITFSIYVKSAGRTWTRICLQYNWTPHEILFNLRTGEAVMPADRRVQPRAYRVESLPDGWYRVSIVESNEINRGMNAAIGILDDNRSRKYAGDGVNGIYIWRPMLNHGAIPAPFTAQGVKK